ncbi:MAG TPA: hypothetical protein PL115_01595 [Bacteroidales bacterium]|jgi:hypothetical protein|nr:hypothetical protein [Bacteroidales bacterium]HKM12776.1 hypothetical protein [Bacteroidales bacterium]HPB89620.1 hypothetical protein [Bacteroidales bacterium]HPY22384.1 hypothetical protein [Bacteroidales bacterium]HQA93433.1 hypothetical protein [Bacteroidales bacterium]
MDKRLQQFLELEDLTPSKLADILQIQRSGISHLLSGRNKPSFDFIQGILTNFPQINPEWLILGKGRPYKSQVSAPPPTPAQTTVVAPTSVSPNATTPSSPATLFDIPADRNRESLFDMPQFVPETAFERPTKQIPTPSMPNDVQEEPPVTPPVSQQVTRVPEPSQPSENRILEPIATPNPNIPAAKRDKHIVRITVFYNDGTFEEK